MKHRKQVADENGYTDEDRATLRFHYTITVGVAVSLFLSVMAADYDIHPTFLRKVAS